MQQCVEDKVIWIEEKSAQFTVQSLFKVLQPAPLISFPENSVWQSKLQPSVCFFAWEAAWGKVLTVNQLQKRGRSLENRSFFMSKE